MESLESSNTKLPKLNKSNFCRWKSQMKQYLLNKGLYGLMNGSEPVLAEEVSTEDVNAFESLQAETLSIICLNIDEDLKYLVKDAATPKLAWKAVCEAFRPATRAKIVALRSKFLNTKFTPPETMSMFLERLLTAAKDLELVGKAIPDDEIAYQMLLQLPKDYDQIVIELCQLSDDSFTLQTVQQALVAEYVRLQHQTTLEGNGTVKVSSAKKMFANLQHQSTEQRKEIRNYDCCYPYDLQWKNSGNAGEKFRMFQRDFNENAEAILSNELISDQIFSNWVMDTASNDNFAMTEHYSLTFALY